MTVGPLVPEIVHSEVWARKIARVSRNVTTAIFIANSNKVQITASRIRYRQLTAPLRVIFSRS